MPPRRLIFPLLLWWLSFPALAGMGFDEARHLLVRATFGADAA